MVHRRVARPPVPVSEFTGFRFPPEVIVLAVRCYLRYALSYRDVEELLAKRGIAVDHVTVYRCCAMRRLCAVRRWESKEVRDLLAGLSQQSGGS